MTKAVFLDRDGVLNEAIVRDGMPYPPATLDEVVVTAGAEAALATLRQAGFRLVMVTNQPDVARGTVARAMVDQINHHLARLLSLDAIEVCCHDNADNCDCRKPKPGMLIHSARRDGIVLAESFMVGDRWRDIEAGRQAGCRTVLIGDGYAEGVKSKPDAFAATVSEAVNWILAQTNGPREQT